MMNLIKTQNRISSPKKEGFTLIEMAVVMLIFGILLIGLLTVYEQYREKKQLVDNWNTMMTVSEGITRYFAAYGRYPCPASLFDAQGDAFFGVAMDDCNTSSPSVAPGSCGPDYCVEMRRVDHDGDPLTPDINRRIRIGAVPFQSLARGLEDSTLGFAEYDDPFEIYGDDMLDAYGNRIMYAVTEPQASGAYLDNAGAILIEDETGRVIHDNADFVLLSHGENGIGSYTYQGVQTGGGCNGGGDSELINCSWDDATGSANAGRFIDALHSESGDSNNYDDTLLYEVWLNYYLWDIPETPGFETAIYNLNEGNVGIGTSTPEDRLHIDGGTNSGVLRAEGILQADEICTADGGACFGVDLIAGTAMGACPSGQLMTGISNNTPECVEVLNDFSLSCPTGFYICGLSYNASSKKVSARCKNPLADGKTAEECN